MEYAGKKTLVTGAGGFIGSHLVEALVASGAEVTALVHYNGRNDWGSLELASQKIQAACRVILGDITDPLATRELIKGQDIVFHLAALIGIPYSYHAPLSYLRTNIEGTVNVLDAARKEAVTRVVQTSTSETYGTARYTPIDEEHPLQGQSPYSASKIAADKMAESYHRSFGVPVITIRPFNTYGPRQSARAVIPTIATQLLAGYEALRLGSTAPLRDMTYVEDTVAGFLAAGLAPAGCDGETINLGSGKNVSVNDIAEMLMEIVGCAVPIVTDQERLRPAKSEVLELRADTTKAVRLLDWQPKWSLRAGLTEVVKYIESNADRFKVNNYVI